MIETDLKKRIEDLSNKLNLDFFILFGSRASNNFKEESDYDFAYYRKKSLSSKEEKKLFDEIFNIVDHNDFDLVCIDERTPPVLKMEIFRKGIIIFEKNHRLYEVLKENAYFDYVDSMVLLEPHKNSFLSSSI